MATRNVLLVVSLLLVLTSTHTAATPPNVDFLRLGLCSDDEVIKCEAGTWARDTMSAFALDSELIDYHVEARDPVSGPGPGADPCAFAGERWENSVSEEEFRCSNAAVPTWVPNSTGGGGADGLGTNRDSGDITIGGTAPNSQTLLIDPGAVNTADILNATILLEDVAAGVILPTILDTTTYVSGTTACDYAGQVHVETDTTVNDLAVCTDEAADTWKFYSETDTDSINVVDTGALIGIDHWIAHVARKTTVTMVSCITTPAGSTADIIIQECTSSGGSCTDTEATMTCDDNGSSTTSIDDPDWDSLDRAFLNYGSISTVPAPTSVTVTVVTKDRP